MGTTKRLVLSLTVGSCCLCSQSLAQAPDKRESQVWTMEGLRNGYCVRFVIEPREAAKELKDGFSLVPASQDQSLHPALLQLIKRQPEFASWSPSGLCFYFSEAVKVGSRRVADKNPRQPQLLALWTIATQDKKSRARRDLVLGFFSGKGSLNRAAETAGVRLHEAHATLIDSAATSNDFYSVKLERTSLTWRGRPTGDSTRVDGPIERSWLVPGLRGATWSAEFAFRPIWSRPLVGSLAVEGKGDLAKALRGSPIRFVGPMYSGGSGEVRFSR